MSAAVKIAPPRFIKLDAGGVAIADGQPWLAVEDTKTGLIWSVEESKPMTWKKALGFPKTLNFCGFTDWRLPECDELLTLVDRMKYSPAIDTIYFPNCQSDWYWSATPYAVSPGGYAWIVYFGNGSSSYYGQYHKNLVRAVRSRQ